MIDKLKIVEADLSRSDHFEDFWNLLNEYATDIMGGGNSISPEKKVILQKDLPKVNGAYVIIAYINNLPVGLANCFEGYSTFNAAPLMNIHDFVVSPEYRNKGIARAMLQHIESYSKGRNFCKLTLEVLEGNEKARKLYSTFGFASYELDPAAGKALFLDKKIQ